MWIDETNIPLQEFIHSPSFNLNEWNYFGVSIFRTNRKEPRYDIHIVSKTMSGVENQDSYFGIMNKDLTVPLVCDKGIDNYYLHYIGAPTMLKKLKFTGN